MTKEQYIPAPLEFLHERIMSLFHDYRRLKTDSIDVEIDGSALNNIIAQAKKETYVKYGSPVITKKE